MFSGKSYTRLGPLPCCIVWNTSLCSGHQNNQNKGDTETVGIATIQTIYFNFFFLDYLLQKPFTMSSGVGSYMLATRKRWDFCCCIYCKFNIWSLNQYFGCLLLKYNGKLHSNWVCLDSVFYFFFSSFLVINIIVHVQYWLKRIFCVLVVYDCFQILSSDEKENKICCNELMAFLNQSFK